jgi:hypothetical protein
MKEMFKDNQQLEKEILTYISQGKKDALLQTIDSLQKTTFANTNIDAVTGKATDDESASQNSVLFSILRKGIESVDLFLENNGLKIPYDDFEDIELMKGLRVAFLQDNIGENGIHKSLFNDYLSRIQELVDLKSTRDDLMVKVTEKNDEQTNLGINNEIKKLNEIIEAKKEEIYDLIDGKDDSYIGRLMLETNPNIMNAIIPTDKESISKNVYGVEYDSLPSMLKDKIDQIVSKRKDSGETELNYMQA